MTSRSDQPDPSDGHGTATPDTATPEYAQRLVELQTARWKRVLHVQAPYRRFLRRLQLGFTLDVGCGIGRNLDHLDGAGVGIDTNPDAVEACRRRGFVAYGPEEFLGSSDAVLQRFDSVLFSHVLEHLQVEDAIETIRSYAPYCSDAGRIVMITPQERGFRSDPTHVEFLDFGALEELALASGLRVVGRRSFPFPRSVGRAFPYNEFVVIAAPSRTS